jgi:tRNA pseudouridine55 synthase
MTTRPALTGLLPLDKTAGVTSFDAVALVRRRLGLKRVGHAGTLDPAATGVLPILLGESTKLMPYLADQDKEYVATLRLGVTTDTGDLGGRVLAERPVPPLDREQMQAACRPFVGRIEQVPPMYSAVHHGGRRLYELARRGIEVVREPREVTIHAIGVEELTGPRARVRIVCGKGTYVRSLAADLGVALGCGAAVERLTRTRVGPFGLAGAVPWEALETEPAETLVARVQPAESALAGWPALRLDARAAGRFEHGQPVEIAPAGAAPGALVRVHGADGRLLGVGEVAAGGRTRPVRVLHADRPGTRVLPA